MLWRKPDQWAELFLSDTGGVSKSILADIKSAIEQEQERLGFQPVTEAQIYKRVLIVSAAAETLLKQGKPKTVLALQKAARDDIKKSWNFLLPATAAAAATNDAAILSDALANVRSLADANPALRDLYFQLQRMHGRFPSIDDHLWFWGPVPADLASFFRTLDSKCAASYLTETTAIRLYEPRDGMGISLDSFRQQLRWGNAVFSYITFLRSFSFGLNVKRKAGEDLTADERQVYSLFTQIEGLLAPRDYGPIISARDSGRSVVLLGAHIGYANAVARSYDHLDMPVTHVFNGTAPSANDRTLSAISPVVDGFQIAFMKLIKSMRSEQRLVEIFPDGGHGQEFLEYDLFSQKVKMGRGAAKIAHAGRAATFFQFLGWKGGKLHTTFTAGPVASAEEDADAFEARLNEFYLTCVRDALLGNPENIGLARAFWPAFTS